MALWLDDGIDGWPEWYEVEPSAFILFVKCEAWMCRALTDGRIPERKAWEYGSAGDCHDLVRVGLWQRTEDGGYVDVRYLELNPTAEKARSNRAAAAARTKKWRDGVHARRRDASRDASSDGVRMRSPSLPRSEERKGSGASAGRSATAPLPEWKAPVDDAEYSMLRFADEKEDQERQEALTIAQQQRMDAAKRGAAEVRAALKAGRS